MLRISIFSIFLAFLVLTGCAQKLTADQITLDNLTPAQATKAALTNIRLGIAYLENDNRERARAKLNKAFAFAPRLPDVHVAFAYLHEQNSDFTKAQEAYQQALRMAPNSGVINNNYGTFLCKRKKYQAAISHFQQAVKDDNYTTVADAYENAGLCALQIPNKQKAKYFFTKALQHDPKRIKSHFGMAQVLYDLHEYNESAKYINAYSHYAKPTPQTLLLSAKIARKRHDKTTLASSALILKKQHPGSKEYSQVRRLIRYEHLN